MISQSKTMILLLVIAIFTNTTTSSNKLGSRRRILSTKSDEKIQNPELETKNVTLKAKTRASGEVDVNESKNLTPNVNENQKSQVDISEEEVDENENGQAQVKTVVTGSIVVDDEDKTPDNEGYSGISTVFVLILSLFL